MLRTIITLLTLLLLVGGGAVFLTQSGLVGGGAVEAAPAIPVTANANLVLADAKIVPEQYATLSLPTGGRVVEVAVKAGEQVAADQLLIKLDDGQQWTAYMQAKAALEVATAQYNRLKAGARPQEIEIAKAALDGAEAQRKQLERQGASNGDLEIADAEVRRATAQLSLLQAGPLPEELEAARAQVSAAQATLSHTFLLLNDTKLIAPFAGKVASVNIRRGEQAAPGRPVIEIGDLASWQIETEDLSELDVVKIQEGSLAKIRVDALPDLELSGIVTEIKAIGENKAGDLSYTVLIQPDHVDARFRWNMSASVEIASSE